MKHALLLSFLVLAPALVAQTPRKPRGVYAKVDISDYITLQQNANPGITPAELDAAFDSLYEDLLTNPAVSGLTLQVHWDVVNPNPPSDANPYEWSYVDDAFAQVAAWNAGNPALAPKTIQFIVTAGFNSPSWVLDQIPSCDGLFQTPAQTPPTNCGTATFEGYMEKADGAVLPMPWNPFYKSAWQTFLTVLAARYESNPAFVSIAVAGPTAASSEMILPNDGNTTNPQTQFGGAGIAPNAMWRQLLALQYPNLPNYQNSDQAFIDEWNTAIDMFGGIFSGVTLVATTGSGLPNFNSNNIAIPAGFAADCPNITMDCAAETTILSYFVDPTVGGANAKSTQTSGLAASHSANLNLGVGGVKWLAQSTAASTQILGGEQFDFTFADDPLGEGCTSPFPPNGSDTPAGCTIPPTCTAEGCVPVACIPQACLAPGVTQASLAGYTKFSQVPATDLIPPEQALYNVLNVYFNGTPAASLFGGTPGAAPFNFLQAYYQDVQYAEQNADAPAQVVETSGVTVSVTAQDLFNLASQKLLEIAEPPEFFTSEVSLGSGVYYLQFPDGNVFGYYNFPSFPILYHYDLGFESFIDALDGNAGAYLYDFASSHWLYTSPALFPYLYDFTLNAWLYYFPDTKRPGHYTTNPRYFSNLSTGKIFTM
jgi:hypothetical protein